MKTPTSLRLVQLGAALVLAGSASAQQPRAGSQLGASSQIGRPAVASQLAIPGSDPAKTTATTAPAWTLPVAPTQAAAPPATPMGRLRSTTATATGRPGGLFQLEDSTAIVVAGRPTSAGALKQRIKADLAAKAGAGKTVHGGKRPQADDRGADTRSRQVATQPTRDLPSIPPFGSFGSGSGLNKPVEPLRPSRTTTTAMPGGVFTHPTTANATRPIASVAETRCLDKGPPVISEVGGRLRPGGKVTVWGKCFGDRTGQVEVIGQFPGGKLNVAFTGWEQTGVDLEMPATVRGATDHTVAVTVVTADGRRSPAMQAKFVAARERIEVPDRLWSPGSGFEIAATSDSSSASNPAGFGHLDRTLRINPQCGLDTMDMDILAGSVSAIRGWELGPANEAAVTIDWAGTCIDTTTNTHYNYVVSQDNETSVRSACHVAMKPRAWAYCPVGVAP